MESRSIETFVGLDVHRKSVVATAVDPLGRPVSEGKFGPTDRELVDYLKSLPGPIRVAIEACSVWQHFYDAAESTGASVVLSNPLRTRLIAEANLKTDRVDSEALATLLRGNLLPTSYAPPPPMRALRSLVRERLFYRRKATSIIVHTYAVMLQRGVQYEDRILVHRRKRESLRELHLEEVDRALDALTHLDATCKDLDRRIHEAYLASDDAQLLATVPGIGELTAVALAAWITPIERFRTAEKLVSYLGLCPTTYQSAETRYYGRLKKDSNELIRTLLVEASWTHRAREKRGIAAKKARRVGRRRGATKGAVAGAHSLAKSIFAMLKRREPFNPHAPGPSTAVHLVRRPRMTAMQCVQRATLGPSTANRLPAP
ncbi:MAG: IS110 family transposase [Thermoplasmata archaeon]